MAAIQQNYGTGRRKSSAARVYLRKGSGAITVNGKALDEFFGRETARMIVRQPLQLVEATDKFDILVSVSGGANAGSHVTWAPVGLHENAGARRPSLNS